MMIENQEKPDWLKVGEWCYVWGEAWDRFRIIKLDGEVAVLVTFMGNKAHGSEPLNKLHRREHDQERIV